MRYNEINKKIWDNIFSKNPNQDESVMQRDDNGNYTVATPIGFDDEQKTYDALKEIIENAIKTKEYKTYKIGSAFVETYGNIKPDILPYDVIYLFTESWEEPLFPVLVKDINISKDEMTILYLGGAEHEDIITKKILFKRYE